VKFRCGEGRKKEKSILIAVRQMNDGLRIDVLLEERFERTVRDM